MNMSNPSIRWTSWLRWLLVSFIGLVGGFIVFVLIGILLGEAGEEAPPFIFGIVLGTIFGTSFGIAHWLFLRRYVSRIAAWVPATVISFALAATIIFGLLNSENSESSFLLRISHAILVGLSLGVAQWLVLRTKIARPAYFWIFFSLGGWIIGELTGIALESLSEEPLPLMGTFLIGASLPGFGMVWLLKRHFQAEAVK